MSRTQVSKELAKVRWRRNPKGYTEQFAAIAERGVGFTAGELARFYCTGLPTDIHCSAQHHNILCCNYITSWSTNEAPF